jgi:hypothetical protein
MVPSRRKSRGDTVGPIPAPNEASVADVDVCRRSLFGVAMQLRDKLGIGGRGSGLEISSIDKEAVRAVSGNVESLRARSLGGLNAL